MKRLIHRGLGFALPAFLCVQSITGAQTVQEKVTAPTRLDADFAAKGFGAAAGKLSAAYSSTTQRYQLFVPKKHQDKETWPLVLFISAGAQPAGWSAWQTVCESQGAFFCSPFAAGNDVQPSERIRIILDVLDDVRRRYRIDPDQTYLSGFSGGGRMACAIGFALPELFGGVAPVCGTNPIVGPTYLRHRIEERLSVAFVTGEKDFNRKENEDYMHPMFEALGIRSKLWVVPNKGHVIPPPAVMTEVYSWLNEDLKRRRADAKARPELALKSGDMPSAAEQGQRFVSAAKRALEAPERTWRGVALLQGTAQRWGATPAGKEARQLLQQITSDEKLLARIAVQGADDEHKSLSAQANGLERFGQVAKAVEVWELLAKNYDGTTIGKDAQAQVRRLSGEKLPTTFIGLRLEGETNVIGEIVPKSPAEQAGLKVGDSITTFGTMKIARPEDLREAMQGLKPDDRVGMEVTRAGRSLMVTLVVGKRPVPKVP